MRLLHVLFVVLSLCAALGVWGADRSDGSLMPSSHTADNALVETHATIAAMPIMAEAEVVESIASNSNGVDDDGWIVSSRSLAEVAATKPKETKLGGPQARKKTAEKVKSKALAKKAAAKLLKSLKSKPKSKRKLAKKASKKKKQSLQKKKKKSEKKKDKKPDRKGKKKDKKNKDRKGKKDKKDKKRKSRFRDPAAKVREMQAIKEEALAESKRRREEKSKHTDEVKKAAATASTDAAKKSTTKK